MAPQLRVAAVQLTSSQDVESNLGRTVHWVRRAAEAGAQLVSLPENFGFLGRDRDKLPHAQAAESGRFVAPLRELARELGVVIAAGSIPEAGPDAGHTYNTTVVIGADGATLATYRKIHLFDIDLEDVSFRESDSVAPGEATVVVEVAGWKLGLSVCYDLRFPELYRALVAGGAEVLMVPAAFTLQTGKDHWEILLRARAIENQCYVVAAGQFGVHGSKRVSWGKTQIIDPWGTQLGVAPEREGLVLATLERADLERVRRGLPCLEHRRL